MTALQAQAFWLLNSVYLEIFLITVIIILLGAAAYCLIFCSMMNDRTDALQKRMRNPWDRMVPQEQPKRAPIERKNLIIGLVSLGLAVLAIILLIIVITA